MLMEDYQIRINMENQIEKPHLAALSKFTSFIQFHQIEAQDIWKYDEAISVPDFISRVEDLTGLTLSLKQTSALLGLSSSESAILKIEDFEPAELWIGQKCLPANEKVSKKNIRAQSAKKKRKDVTIESNNQYFDEFDEIEPQLSSRHKLGISSNESSLKASQAYKSQLKHKLNETELQEQIEQNSLDKKWDYLLKVGEMNNWMKCPVRTKTRTSPTLANDSNRNPLQQLIQDVIPAETGLFKVYGDGNDIQITWQNSEGQEELLPLKVFDQKYQSCKKKFAPSDKYKNNMKGTMMMVLDGKERFCKSKMQEKISQRDQQLNYLLLEIMREKAMMELQERILKECGVNS